MFCLLMYLLINLIIATMLWQPTFKWLEIKIISPIENVEKNKIQWESHSAQGINSDSQI